MVTEEIGFPVRVPSPVTVGLGIMTFTVTERTAILPATADPFFFAAVLRYGQECRPRQEPDVQDRSTPCGWKDPEIAAYKDGK